MKVVLFCGGLGMRIREYPDPIPKPMIPIGYRPLLWHLMKYYAHFGHKEFVLCLGYRADVVKNYFLGYNECVSNDFILADGGKRLKLLGSDIQDWSITFVDTGVATTIGERLMAARPYLQGEHQFLANYSDGLSDLPLDTYINAFEAQNRIASFLTVRPPQTYHVVTVDGCEVTQLTPIDRSGIRVNGGFFVFRSDIFRYLRPGEDLVEAPFERLVSERQIMAYSYDGFWGCMDTFKDKERLDELHAQGRAPWEIWKPKKSIADEKYQEFKTSEVGVSHLCTRSGCCPQQPWTESNGHQKTGV